MNRKTDKKQNSPETVSFFQIYNGGCTPTAAGLSDPTKKGEARQKGTVQKLSFFIRKITIPPVFAALLLILAFLLRPTDMGSALHLSLCLFCLALLPCLAYPLQRFFKGFKDKGRDGQRTLAMLFSFAGYVLAVVGAYLLSAPRLLQLLCLEYLLCGIAILLFNKVFHLKVSGHACGIVGPVLLALYFRMYLPATVGALLILPVFYASIKTKRHTPLQLLGGAAIPAVTLLFLLPIFA